MTETEMSNAYWNAVKKKRIHRIEYEWKRRRYAKTPPDAEALIKAQKRAEANWRKRRRASGSQGVQTALCQ